jgi:hypothetical protein
LRKTKSAAPSENSVLEIDLFTSFSIPSAPLRSTDKRSYKEEWILEGHLHVLFVLGLLCDRDGADLSDVKAAALRIGEAIDIVGDFVKRHSNVAAYRLFRSVETSTQLSKAVGQTKR